MAPRLYQRDSRAESRARLTPEGYSRLPRHDLRRTARAVVVRGPDRKRLSLSSRGRRAAALPGLSDDDRPRGWTADGRTACTSPDGQTMPLRVVPIRHRDGHAGALRRSSCRPTLAGLERHRAASSSRPTASVCLRYLRILSYLRSSRPEVASVTIPRLHDAFHRNEARPLRDPRADRRGRDGRGVQGAGRAVEAGRGGQGAARGAGGGRASGARGSSARRARPRGCRTRTS